MRQIEEFEVVTNGISDWIGHIELDLVADPVQRAMLEQGTYGPVEVAGKLYTRCGMYQKNFGTLLTREQFRPYFDAYGQVMMTQAEWARFLTDNAPQEVDDADTM